VIFWIFIGLVSSGFFDPESYLQIHNSFWEMDDELSINAAEKGNGDSSAASMTQPTGDCPRSMTSCQICVPFPSENHAEIVYNSLRIDKEPKRSHVEKKLSVTGRNLHVHFEGKDAKSLRTSVNNFFELLLLSTRTIEIFG